MLPDEIRENDLSLFFREFSKNTRQKNGYYPPSLEGSRRNRIFGKHSLRSRWKWIRIRCFPRFQFRSKDQCYRLSAQLSSQSLQKMKSDNSIDPNALEVGECFLSHSFPLYEPRNEETEDNMWKEVLPEYSENGFRKDFPSLHFWSARITQKWNSFRSWFSNTLERDSVFFTRCPSWLVFKVWSFWHFHFERQERPNRFWIVS